MDIVSLRTEEGLLHWVRLEGQPERREFRQLGDRLGALHSCGAVRFVLDFSAVDHLDYRAVPHLLELVRAVEGLAADVRVVGLSDYLRRILDFGGALDSRELLDRYAPVAPPDNTNES